MINQHIKLCIRETLHTHLQESCYLSTSFWPIHSSNPVVSKPVGENTRVIKTKDIDVCSMDKIVRQNHNIAFAEPRTDDTNLGRIESLQFVNELLRPSRCFHHSVVVHTIVVVHVVHVRCHHGIILCPRRTSGMLTLNKMQADIRMKSVAFWTLQLQSADKIHTIDINNRV